MYRGYKTYRHFLNYSLHALSVVICGDDTVIDEELSQQGLSSVKELSDKEARLLYRQLSEVAKRTAKHTSVIETAIGLGKMTDRQRKAIIKISKYNFNWSNEATFSFIAEMFPDYRKRMSLWEVENSKLNKLFGLLTMKDADKIIKRLLSIEKRNSGLDQSAKNGAIE